MSTKLELLLLMQRLDRCNAAAGDGMGEGEATDEDQPGPGTGGEGDGGALAGFVFEGGAVGLAEAVAWQVWHEMSHVFHLSGVVVELCVHGVGGVKLKGSMLVLPRIIFGCLESENRI